MTDKQGSGSTSDGGSTADSEGTALTPPEPSASDLLSAALGNAARQAGLDPSRQASTGHVVWAAMGGWRGIAESVLPSLAFILAFTLWTGDSMQKLIPALIISVGLAVVFTVLRLMARSTPTAAIGGLMAAVVAAALALFTGNASNNFVPGLITNAAYGLALLVSALIGWSLIGLAAGYLMGEGTAWRRSKRKRRVYFWLAIAWAALFFLRLAVQFPVYLASLQPGSESSAVALLGTLKLVMGLPLFAPLVAVTWLTVRALYRRADAGSADGPGAAAPATD